MKTTQKNFLLLCLCTFFGFLVYVDFMGGVRGDESEKVENKAYEALEQTNAYQQENSIAYSQQLAKTSVITGRYYDKSVYLESLYLHQYFDSVRSSIKDKTLSAVELTSCLESVKHFLMKFNHRNTNDTYGVMPVIRAAKVNVPAHSSPEVRLKYSLSFLIRLELQLQGVVSGYIGRDGPMFVPAPIHHVLPKLRVPSNRLKRMAYSLPVHSISSLYSKSIIKAPCKAKVTVTGKSAFVILEFEDVKKSNSDGIGVRVPEGAEIFYAGVLAPQMKCPKLRIKSIEKDEYFSQIKFDTMRFRDLKLPNFHKKLPNSSNMLSIKLNQGARKINLENLEIDSDWVYEESYYFLMGNEAKTLDAWVSKNMELGILSESYIPLLENEAEFPFIEQTNKLITYDLPLTPTPEGYMLDWSFPTNLYPLELELEVFPAAGQQLVISKDFKGEDLPQGGKHFFWKKFPAKNLHLELKGKTTVVLQSEAQENEVPAFSLSARADLPQEKAAPQHTAFLIDASARTKAQRFGEYATLLLQLLEKEEKYIPSFSLFYFQDEAKAYGKALPNTPTERQKLRRFLQNLKPQGEGALEEALPKFAEFAPKGSRALFLAAGNIHHGDVHEIADSLGNHGVKIHPNSPMAHAAPLLQKGLRCYTLEDGIAEQHHPLLNYIAHASGGQRLRFHGLKDAENVMQKLLSQPWKIEKIEVEGTKDLLFSKQIHALLPEQHFQLNGKGQWPGEAKIHLRSTDGRRKTLAFEAETLSSPLPPREHARALLEVYAAKGNTPETRFHEATLRKKYNIAGRFFRFSNQLEEAYASPYSLLRDFDPDWRESTLEKNATLQNHTDAFPNYSPRRVLFAALNRYALAHEKAFSPEEKALFLDLPESAFEKREIAQWIAHFEKATPRGKDVKQLKEVLLKM